MALTVPAFQSLNFVGAQPIADTSTTKQHNVGTRCRAYDANFGEIECIYLVGAASTARGDAVVYNADDYTTARTGARSKGHFAVALSANVASQYGWYAIFGNVPVTAGTVLDNTAVYLTGTAGSVDDAVVAGDQVFGAIFASATDTGLAEISLSYPFCGDTDNA